MKSEDKKPAKVVIRTNPNDHLANERTFLAWIRTGIAIMGLGFIVVKFAVDGEPLIPGREYSSIIGISLVAIASGTVLLSFIRYRTIERELLSASYHPSSSLSFFLTLVILAAGVTLAIYLLSTT